MARQEIVGIFVKRNDENTITVKVEKKFRHPKYGKTITKHKSFLVDIALNTELELEEKVIIGQIKPVSKRKSFEFISKFDKA